MEPHKRLFVLSFCGTSLLTNGAEKPIQDVIKKYANTTNLNEIPGNDAAVLEKRIQDVRQNLCSATLTTATFLSAELNGIIKLYQGQLNAPDDYHLLLCTDTWLGEQTAHLVEEWLRQYHCVVEVRRQRDLQTTNLDAFQLALSDLVKWCEEIIPEYRKAKYHVVFNLTAGFKSVQGFLQTLAMFYADEAVYVFETGKELLRIPSLPIVMAKETVVREYLPIFRRLALKLPVDNLQGIPETLLMRIGEQVCFSAWGELVWKQTRKRIYQDQLFPAPSERLIFSKPFENSVNSFEAQRKILINERIDQLALCLETNGQQNPSSLNFKPLQGNPVPSSTHEFYAWSDQDAKRIFGHYEGNVFMIDKLDRHL